MLLLAAHGGGLGGDETFDHLTDERKGDEPHDDPGDPIGVIEKRDVIDAEEDVIDQ